MAVASSAADSAAVGNNRKCLDRWNDFIPAKKFNGAKNGYVFQQGNQGLGYYPNKRRSSKNDFIQSNNVGPRNGYTFKNGPNGKGYYKIRRNNGTGGGGSGGGSMPMQQFIFGGGGGGGFGGGGGGSGGGGANANALKMNRNRLQKEMKELQGKLMRNKFKTVAEKVMAKKKFNKKQAEFKAAFLKERAELQKKINNAEGGEKNKLKANLLRMSEEMKSVIGEKNKKIKEIEEELEGANSLLMNVGRKLVAQENELKNANVARNQAIKNKANANRMIANRMKNQTNALLNSLNKMKMNTAFLKAKKTAIFNRNNGINMEKAKKFINKLKDKQKTALNNLRGKIEQAGNNSAEKQRLQSQLEKVMKNANAAKTKANANKANANAKAAAAIANRNKKGNEMNKALQEKNANKEAALAAKNLANKAIRQVIINNKNAQLKNAKRNLENAQAKAEQNLANATQAAKNAATKQAQNAARRNIEAAQEALKLAQEQVERQTENMKNKNKKLKNAEMNRKIAQGEANRKNKNKQNALNQQKEALNENLKRQLAEKQEALNAQLKNARNEARKAGGANAKANANAEIEKIKAKLEKVKTNALRQQKAAMIVQGAFKRAKNRESDRAGAYNQGITDGRASTINNPLYATVAQKAANNGNNNATQKAANKLRNRINSIKPLKPKPGSRVSFGVNTSVRNTRPGERSKVNAEGFTEENPRRARPKTNSNRKAINQAVQQNRKKPGFNENKLKAAQKQLKANIEGRKNLGNIKNIIELNELRKKTGGIVSTNRKGRITRLADRPEMINEGNENKNFGILVNRLKPNKPKLKEALQKVREDKVRTNARLAAKELEMRKKLGRLQGANRVRESRRQAANKERQGGKEQKQVAGLFKVGKKVNVKRMMKQRDANRDEEVRKVGAQLESREARKQAEEAQRKARLDKKKKELTNLAMGGGVLTKTPSNFNNQNFRNVISKLTVNNLEVMVNRESDVNAEPFVDQVKNDIKEKIAAKKPTKIPITNSNSNSNSEANGSPPVN